MEEYKKIVYKVKLDEFDSQLNNVLFNQATVNLESILNQQFKEKYTTCINLVSHLKSLTTDGKITTKISNYKSPELSGEVTQEHRSEFDKNLKLFDKCSSKFFLLDFKHKNKNIFLDKFTNQITENCLKDNCEALVKTDQNNYSQTQIKNCVRDCLRLNLMNKTAMIRLMDENNMKYIKDLGKI